MKLNMRDDIFLFILKGGDYFESMQKRQKKNESHYILQIKMVVVWAHLLKAEYVSKWAQALGPELLIHL